MEDQTVPKSSYIALRPVKLHGKEYGVGSRIDLDEETAAHIGITAVTPYVPPVSAMTSAELLQASRITFERERAEKGESYTGFTAGNFSEVGDPYGIDSYTKDSFIAPAADPKPTKDKKVAAGAAS